MFRFFALFFLIFGFATSALAQTEFVRRYGITASGALVFTGNTLGMNKASGTNNPGTQHSIGAFTSLNVGDQANANWTTATYGPTTLDYTRNGSTAQLKMPANSKILHAELIWGASYNLTGQTLTSAQYLAPITLAKVSDGVATVTSSTTSVTAAANARFTSLGRYYVNAADVTNFVQNNGAGFYACKGVPGTVSASDDSANCAGWTLAVVYGNDGLPTRNMTIFVGADLVNSGNSATKVPVVVRGFCTAPFGSTANPKTRLALSALEGDSSNTGDQFKFGSASASMSALANGTANPQTNFFAGQLNTNYDANLAQNGTRDSGVSPSSPNHTPSTNNNTTGARQGYDITNVDVTAQMNYNQQEAYFTGTSDGDEYTLNAAGLQIDVGAPTFPDQVKTVDKTTTFVGDVLTYTVTLNNGAGTADALNVVLYDNAPLGTTFIPGSFKKAGVAIPGADPRNGVNMGNIAQGASTNASFQVRVDSVPPAPALANFRNTARWVYEFQSCSFGALTNEAISTNEVVTTSARLEPTKTVSGPNPQPMTGDVLTYTISIPNTGTADTAGTTFLDAIPAGVLYKANSTTLNGSALADNGGFPFRTAREIHSNGDAAGVVKVGKTATVTFQAIVQANAPPVVTNIATVDVDGSGNAPAQQFGVSIPAIQVDLGVALSDGQTTVSPGAAQSYVATITNNGPSPINRFNLIFELPPDLKNVVWTPSSGTYDPITGDWVMGSSLNVGQSVTMTAAGTLDGATTTAPVARAVVAVPPGVSDTVSSNNSATDTDTLDRRADLGIAKTDNRDALVAGGAVNYVLTVTNNGPATLDSLFVQDVLPATIKTPTYAPSEGSYTISTGQWTGLNLEAGQSVRLTISATVDSAASGTISNTATVGVPSGVTDSNAANNSATDTSTIGYAISGRVYLDSNSNSALDGGESGFNGTNALWIKVRTTGNALSAAPVAADGTYVVTVSAPGTYSLFADTNANLTDITPGAPTGYSFTESAPGTRTASVVTELNNQNFGLFSGSQISGVVINDNGIGSGGVANDGQKNGTEGGIGGVRVSLKSNDLSQTFSQTYTDTAGNFSLSIPPAAMGVAVKVVQENLADFLSTGGRVGTTGGTYLRTTDALTFTPATGQSYSGVVFADVARNTFDGDGAQVAARGGAVLYSHLFTANSAGNVTFSDVETLNPNVSGWNTLIFRDANANGLLDAGETQVSGAISVVAGQKIALLLKNFVPQNAPVNATDRIEIRADFSYANAAPALSDTLSRFDTTTVAGEIGLQLVKSVNKTTAKSGDILTYQIAYSNTGAEALKTIVIADATPAFTTFQSASFDALPQNLTACAITKPAIGAKGALRWTFTGTLAPNQSGIVRFSVKVE